MKNILTESTKSKFKVLEHKPKNVLKRIQGVLSDFKSNRNGRIYPRELWENVLNSDYVKEMIESHGLVGELDHPEERLEISLQNVSHVINDMWIEGDQVLGTIDILPTPSGKIVSELIDYGTDIGISSRGAGTVGAGNIVDPDYQFVTFDFVARPSCEAARLNMIVESVQPEIDTNTDDKVKNILEGYRETLKEDNTTSLYIDLKEIVKYAENYLSDKLNSSVGIAKQSDGQYMITMKNSRETIDKWLEIHGLNESNDQKQCNMAAVDMVKDALFNQLGSDWRKKSLVDIEDIVHDAVYKYNEANAQPEYKDEDFYCDEANAREIYQYILDNEINKKEEVMKEFVYRCAECGRQCDDDYNLGTLIDGQWYCETCVTDDVRDCFGRPCTFPELVDSCRAQLLDGALDDPEHVKTLNDSQLNDLAQQYAEEEWKNAKPSDEANIFESLRESYVNEAVSELLD